MAKKLKPVHPGEVLSEDFMKPYGLSMNKLALDLRLPVTRIADIVAERRGITAGTALRLARYFKTTAQFWLNLQTKFDLEIAEDEELDKIERDVRPIEVDARQDERPQSLLNGIVVAGVAGIDRFACCEAFVLGVVKANAVLAQLPAEIHFLIVNTRGKIEQADVQILHHAAGFLNLIERGLDGFFQAVAFEPDLRRLFVRHRQAARALNALRECAELPIHVIHLAPRFHSVDQDRLQLCAQPLCFRQREILRFFVGHF
jgi:addiction module HigA family antidote